MGMSEQSIVPTLMTQVRRTQQTGLMTRTACWSGKLKYFGSDASELVEARAGVSGQQDPAGCGGRGGDHHVVCGSRPSFRHRCYRQARMHPGDAYVVWLDGKAGQDCLHADGARLAVRGVRALD